MDRSPYLAQAIQAMSQPMAEPASQGPSLSQMAQAVKQRQAWETANPGQSYMAHNVQQMGQNIANVPNALMGGASNLAALPGDALNGLLALGSKLPGVGPQPAQYGGVPAAANYG